MENYRSKGEKEIARILSQNKIEFYHEYPLCIKDIKENDSEKLRLWYPDFWLPKYSIVIEYFGMENDKNYQIGKKLKLEAYRRLDIDCISVKPSTLKKNLKSYLLMTIKRLINEKVRHFESRKKTQH